MVHKHYAGVSHPILNHKKFLFVWFGGEIGERAAMHVVDMYVWCAIGRRVEKERKEIMTTSGFLLVKCMFGHYQISHMCASGLLENGFLDCLTDR
jgi:hypothetical protein